MKYSAKTGLFYDPAWHYNHLPDDIVDVTREDFNALQKARVDGLVIVSDGDGFPVLAEPEPRVQVWEDVEIARLRAYADPVFGSDRYRAEASAERLAGNEAAAIEAEQKLLARRAEIKSQNPWPESN